MAKQISIYFEGEILREYQNRIIALMGLSDGSLGVAVANEKGYYPINRFWFNAETFDEAVEEADRFNKMALNLSEKEVAEIVMSTMREGD